jgi:polysaccharide biosynthesis PFTS motif protein
MIRMFLKRSAWKRLLYVLRGHRHLKEINSIGRIIALKNDLASTPCIKNGSYSKWIYGYELERAELITRQFLLARIESDGFAKNILYSVGNAGSSITYPLPSEWRKVVNSHGFNVNKYSGILYWNAFVILKFVSAILSFALKIFGDLKQLIRKDNPLKGRYVYFDTLTRRNFPLTSSKGPIHNILTWYLQWSDKSPNFDSLCHDVKGINKVEIENIPVIPIPSALPFLTKMRGLLSLVLWGFIMILFSLIDLIRGHWWHALLFGESYKAKVFKIADHDELAKDYLFHNSGWIYRPLWTYEVERRGSRILFYFYSTNVEGFKQVGGYSPAYFGWATSTWENFLVWDHYQQDFVNRSLQRKVNTNVVGPIWFESGVEEIPNFSQDYIAVFDVQPVRDAFYNTLGIPFDYYIPTNCNQFLSDILDLSNTTLVLKRKRNIGKLIHYRYRNLLSELEKHPNFISLDPDTAAHQIVENCKAVISMPFTATALIAERMGKPSIYYDPSGLIQKDDRGAHGIKIVSGPKELEVWLEGLSKEP